VRVSGGRRPVWTDAAGAYVVPDGPVVPGARASDPSFVPIVVTADGFIGSVQAKVPANAGDEVRAPDVVLAQGWSVEGRVTGPDGKPAPFARVWVFGREGVEGASTGADGSGGFVLHGLAGNQWTVYASGPLTLGAGTIRSTFGADRNVVAMRSIVDVRGRVRSADGAPVEGVGVSIVFGSGKREIFFAERERTNALTGPDGEFRLYSTSTYAASLIANARGWRTWTGPLPATTEPIEIVLTR
jgi:hypothetical protein